MRGSKSDLPVMMEAGEAAIRGADWGGMRALVVSLPTGTDITPLLKGLPDDRCSCPHWGYVIKGRLRLTAADGEETLQAGDVFYMAPGRTPSSSRRPSSSSSSRLPMSTRGCSTSCNGTRRQARPEHTQR